MSYGKATPWSVRGYPTRTRRARSAARICSASSYAAAHSAAGTASPCGAGFIDDHSRLVPYAEFFFDEALPRMERVLKVGILRRGLPRAIYVDNGQVYSATQFAAACATLGVHRIQASPYAPEGKGKQERFFETLRLQFLPEVETSDLTTLSALNESLWAWLECLYHSSSAACSARLHADACGRGQARPQRN